MPWAGYAVSRGEMSFLGVVAAGSVGSFLGAVLWYYAARAIGKDRLAVWIEDYGAWLTIKPGHLDAVDDWLMKQRKILLFTAIGTVLWTAMLASLGRWLAYSRSGCRELCCSVGNGRWRRTKNRYTLIDEPAVLASNSWCS